jgi:hypothetical protein
MICIIVDNHAHRLLKSGVVESRRIVGDGELLGIMKTIESDDWQILNPRIDLGIDEGEFHVFIKKQLETLHGVFPSDRPKLPSMEKVENVASPVSEMRI